METTTHMKDTLDYLNDYYDFIQRHRNDVFEDGEQFDLHHIVCRAFNGTDDESNLIKLRPHDHLVAHRLIVKCCEPGSYERRIMQYAVLRMSKLARYQ
jgi:hypothetical protein